MSEQVLVASRRKIIVHAAGAGLLLAASLVLTLLPADAESMDIHLYAIAGVFLFGAALIASIVRLLRPYSLRLEKDALVIQRSFRQPRRIAWSSVQEFFARGSTIQVRYDRAHGLTGLAMGSNSGFGTEEGLMVGEFAMPPDQITELLNTARANAAEAVVATATAP